MGSVAAKFRGANDADLPPFVGLADSWAADVWESGQMGSDFAPVKGTELQGKFAMPPGINVTRLFDHHGDNVRWGGIEKGLTPLLPRVDRTLYALVNDLFDNVDADAFAPET